nr:hypothetical protein [Bryobacterales bacterium]
MFAPIPILEDGESSLSSGELEELDHLLDAQENGEDIDEDRLYELDLFDRWKSGNSLDQAEIKDLLSFKMARKIERMHSKEHQQLLEKRAKGHDVDEDRLYCLELLAHKRAGGNLTEEEVLDLVDFQNDESKAMARPETLLVNSPSLSSHNHDQDDIQADVIQNIDDN